MKIYNDGSVTAASIRSMLHSILQFGKPILPNPEKNQLPAGIGRAVPSQRTGHLAMLLFAVLIAGSFSIGRTAVQHVGPGALTVMRFILGSALMGTAAALSLRRWPRLPAAPWRFLLLGALMGFYFIAMFEALKITDPVSTGAVFTLMPLMSAGFGWLFLKQAPRPFVLACLIVAGAGAVWVIFDGDVEALQAFAVGKGEVIFFFGCVAHAAYSPLVRLLNRGEPVAEFTFYTLAGSLIAVSLYGARETLATDWASMPAIVWIAVGYLSVFTTGITFFLLQFSSMRLPAAKVMAYGYLTPVFIILIEGFAGHGWASFSVVAGALVIVAALAALVAARD